MLEKKADGDWKKINQNGKLILSGVQNQKSLIISCNNQTIISVVTAPLTK